MNTPAKQTPESELPRAIAEAMGWTIAIYGQIPFYGSVFEGMRMWLYPVAEWNPLRNNDQFHELTGNPETHARICDVLDEWFGTWDYIKDNSEFNFETSMEWRNFWQNPTYLTENGGWRAWWLRAYLEILLDDERG